MATSKAAKWIVNKMHLAESEFTSFEWLTEVDGETTVTFKQGKEVVCIASAKADDLIELLTDGLA